MHPIISNAQSQQQIKKATRPNIIFILVDDQGYGDVGAFFQNQRARLNDPSKPFELSPNLDKLAAAGAMLTHHYVAAPVCAPSRASILLGVSQGHSNVRDGQFDKALADNYTMASTLKQLGYSTAVIGKWGLQGDPRWDKNGAAWSAEPRNRGFDYFFGYMRHSDGHQHYPKEGIYTGKKEVWDNGVNIASKLDKCYTADLWTAVAKKWIENHEKEENKDKPFFMYLAYETPHAVDELPTQKYPEGGGIHGGMQLVGTPGHYINTASGEIDSYINSDYVNATYDNDNNPATPEIPWPDTYKRYAMANRRIDDGVGDLVQLLKDLHIDSNTMIVYTSDNGPSVETYLGKKQEEEEKYLPTFFGSYGPFDGIKRDNWEGGVRVPTIAVWPGHIPSGKVVKSPSISYDWAPTFINAAGQPAPERMDGVSLIPSLTGIGNQRSSLIYIEYYENGKTPDFIQFAPNHRDRIRKQMNLLRIGDFVGVRYNIQSANDSFEIYNVVNDPQELNNLTLKPDKRFTLQEKTRFDSKSLGRMDINKLETYMKAHALQVRRPDTSYLATEKGIAKRPYDSTLIPPVKAKVTPGVNWKVFEGTFPWIPQIVTLTPIAKGHAAKPAADVTSKNNNGLLFFEGYMQIPADGKYTFYLTSNTKTFLRIHEAQVIDEDFGYKGGTEGNASILLKAGLHPFRLYYQVQDKDNSLMNFEWSGPGISKQHIPQNIFFRKKNEK